MQKTKFSLILDETTDVATEKRWELLLCTVMLKT